MALPKRSENGKAKRRRRSARFEEPRATRRTRPITRNVETTTPTVTPSGSAPTTDEQFRTAYAEQGLQPLDRTTPTAEPPPNPTRAAAVTYPPAVPLPAAPARPSRQQQTRQKKKKLSATEVGFARARATGVNVGIFSAGMFGWSVFQVPMAVISIVSFGLAAAIASLYDFVEGSKEDGFFIQLAGDIIGIGVKTVEAVASAVDWLFDINLAAFHPATLFFITHLIIMAYGVIIISVMYLAYKFAHLNPLSGRSESLKMGTFLLAFIGYTIPILNFFPWFIPWAIVVWRHPK